MKTLVGFVVYIFLSCPLLAQVWPSTISVTGSGEISVVPDQVELVVGVETRHENLLEAQRQNDIRVSAALRFLKDIRINEKDIQTDFLDVHPDYDSNPSITEPVAFTVTKNVSLQLTNVAGLQAILNGLLTNGVNHVRSVKFRTSELKKLKKRVRLLAVKDAKEKADALASELGVRRGKVHSVGESEWGGGYGGGGSGGGGSPEDRSVALAAGQIRVSTTVSVAFLVE
jgi:uncharacterized protein